MRCAILVFVKFPEPGKVKTRLAAAIGAEEAAAVYRQLVTAVLCQLPVENEVVICFDPSDRENEVRKWIGSLLPLRPCFSPLPQGSGDLGARLERAFDALFARGCEAVAVIGSDCIEIAPETFTEVEVLLGESDAVIGPSFDGGYYLLALKKPCPTLFRDIPWSTGEVLAATRVRTASEGLRMAELPPLHDVDDLTDWERVQARFSLIV